MQRTHHFVAALIGWTPEMSQIKIKAFTRAQKIKK
jgi:hypothetical protein